MQFKEEAENSDSKTLLIEELKYQIQQLQKKIQETNSKKEKTPYKEYRDLSKAYSNRKYLDISGVRSNDGLNISRLEHSHSSGNLKSTKSYNPSRVIYNSNSEIKVNLKSTTAEVKKLLG